MLRFVEIRPEGRDGTCWYNILLVKNYTVQEFVRDVLKQFKDSWGSINIEINDEQINSYDYAYGKLKWKSKFKNMPKDKKVISATANGGYSFLNFYLTVSE